MGKHSIIYTSFGENGESDKNLLFEKLREVIEGLQNGHAQVIIRDSKIVLIAGGESLRLSDRIYEIMELRW